MVTSGLILCKAGGLSVLFFQFSDTMSHWNTESNRITVIIFVYDHTSTVIIPESRHVSEAKYLTRHTLLSGYVHKSFYCTHFAA
jgi:hypothetical protein